MTTGNGQKHAGMFSRILRGAEVRLGKLIDDGWFWKSMRLRDDGSKLTAPVEQIPSVYASISRVAALFAAVPIKFVSGEGEDKRELGPKDSEIAKLFRHPNPALPARSLLWEVTIFQKLLKGGSYWILTGPDGARLATPEDIPEMIFPIPGTSIIPRVDKKTGMILEGYSMKTDKGKDIDYRPHEVIPFRFPHPIRFATKDFAPLDVAKISVEQDHSAKRWNRALFKNFCQPSGVVTIEGTALPEEREEIREEIKDRHQGEDKQYDVAVLPMGAKWEKTSDSARDMQFLELLRFTALEVYEVFGVNKFVVGDVEELNFASALVAERQVYRHRVLPEIAYTEDVLEPFIDRWSGGLVRAKFDTSGVEALQQGFSETILQAKGLQALGYPINKVNERLGLGMAEIDGGDESLVGPGLKPLSDVLDGSGDADAFSFSLAARALSRAAGAAASAKEAESYWRAFAARGLDPFEKRMVKKLRRIWFDLQKETLENLAAVTAEDGKDLGPVAQRILNPDIDRILYDEEKATAKIRRALEPIFFDIFEEALAILGEEIPGGLSLVDSKDLDLLEFLETKMIRVTRISETVREQIRTALAKAITDKATVQQITERIRDRFKFARARSLTIARTETAQTSSGIRQIAMKKEGIEKHRWIPANDDEVRESHERAREDPEGWTVKVGQQFPNGLTYPSEVGGPAEEVINCRCVAVPWIEEN